MTVTRADPILPFFAGQVLYLVLAAILQKWVPYFTTVSSIRVSRVGTVGRVRVTLTVTVRVSRVSVMVSVRDSVK